MVENSWSCFHISEAVVGQRRGGPGFFSLLTLHFTCNVHGLPGKINRGRCSILLSYLSLSVSISPPFVLTRLGASTRRLAHMWFVGRCECLTLRSEPLV